MVVERIPGKIEPDNDQDTQPEDAGREHDVAASVGAQTGGALWRGLRLVLKFLLPVLLIFAAMGVRNYFVANKPAVFKRPAQERTFVIKTVPVRFTAQQPKIKLFGKTVTGRKVELRALVSGQVIEVGEKLRDGAIIDAGATLLKIDPFEYRGALTEAKAQMKEANARLRELRASLSQEKGSIKRDKQQLQLAIKDAERARPLVRRGTISQKTLDDRDAVVLQRRQSLEQRQNNIAVWDAKIEQQNAALERLGWAQERADRRIKDTTLKAPFKAYVDAVNAEVGKTLSANDRVATLFDVNTVDVEFTLTDQQYGRIIGAEGSVLDREIDVEWSVGRKPIKYKATVERVSAQIDANAGGITVYARIKEPTKPIRIRPGAFVQLHVPDRKFENVAVLPVTALYDGDTVFVVAGEGRLEPRKVDVVGWDGANVFVRGALRDNERILRTRLSTPVRGLKVRETRATGS